MAVPLGAEAVFVVPASTQKGAWLDWHLAAMQSGPLLCAIVASIVFVHRGTRSTIAKTWPAIAIAAWLTIGIAWSVRPGQTTFALGRTLPILAVWIAFTTMGPIVHQLALVGTGLGIAVLASAALYAASSPLASQFGFPTGIFSTRNALAHACVLVLTIAIG